MKNYLDEIVLRKKNEIELLKKKAGDKSFKKALKSSSLNVIAEIKRRSPSKGALADIANPAALAKKYVQGGAAAFSILTDEAGFGGSLSDLAEVAKALPGVPILRKDFIVDLMQLRETVQAGAGAILLIVAALKQETSLFLQEARKLGLEALVEVHDEEELKIALDAKADIIGVNSRNMANFEIDLEVAVRIGALIPQGIVKVAESGIRNQEDARKMRRAGFDAILVGEALVRSEDPAALLEELRR